MILWNNLAGSDRKFARPGRKIFYFKNHLKKINGTSWIDQPLHGASPESLRTSFHHNQDVTSLLDIFSEIAFRLIPFLERGAKKIVVSLNNGRSFVAGGRQTKD